MSNVDTAWLRMEKPSNLMMITGVLRLASPLTQHRLAKLLEERFLAFPRFRQRAVDSPEGAHWETVEDFDIARHVSRLKLGRAANERRLKQAVSELASTPLSAEDPRWHFHLIERYQGGSVVICRIHHCYADGMALVQVMLSLTDSSPDAGRAASNCRPCCNDWMAPSSLALGPWESGWTPGKSLGPPRT